MVERERPSLVYLLDLKLPRPPRDRPHHRHPSCDERHPGGGDHRTPRHRHHHPGHEGWGFRLPSQAVRRPGRADTWWSIAPSKWAVCHGASRWQSTPDQPPRLDDMIAESPAMQRVAKEIGKLATSQATVLLQGESGTGKRAGGPHHPHLLQRRSATSSWPSTARRSSRPCSNPSSSGTSGVPSRAPSRRGLASVEQAERRDPLPR